MRIKYFIVGVIAACLAWPVVAAISASVQNEIVEFHHKALDHYFISADPKEIADLDSGIHPGWARTGYRFPGIKTGSGQPATSPVCRFYGKPEASIDSHFYSSKPSECNDVKEKFGDSWQFEADEVFRAYAVDGNTGKCPADTVPVYRLWNQRSDVNHRYTDQLTVYQQMVNKGYKAEGDGSPAQPVAFCMPAGGSTVPGAVAGAPSCTLAATTSAPALGSTLALTATCSGLPTSYTWTGCSGTTKTCQVTASTAGPAAYSVTATNALGTSQPVTLSVNWGSSTGLPTGPGPVCTVSGSTGFPTVGAPLTLTANCSQTPTRWDWYECNYMIQTLCTPIPTCPTSASCTFTGNVPGLAHYAVAASNAQGLGDKAGIDIEWGGSTGGGGAVMAPPVCTAYTSHGAPTVGSAIVLSASCTGNPTSFAWTGVSCSSASCSTSSATAGALSYSFTASNALGTSGPANVTVNWQPPGVPSCTISANNMNPTVGQTIAVTASCNGSPTSYVWTGCQSTGSGCSDQGSAAGPKTYRVTASNVSGAGSPVSVTVNWAAAPTAPPSCTVSSSDASPFAGQQITLSASCTNSPSSYAWSNCSSSGATCTTTSSSSGSRSYSVTATNVVGASAPASTTVSWQQAQVGADFCGNNPHVVRLDGAWGKDIYPNAYGGQFNTQMVLVVAIRVPSSPSSYGTPLFSASLGEYGSTAVFAHATLSRSSCDFRAMDSTGVNGPFSVGYSQYASVYGTVGTSMQPGQTYYLNIQWNAPAKCNGSCASLVGFQWPR